MQTAVEQSSGTRAQPGPCPAVDRESFVRDTGILECYAPYSRNLISSLVFEGSGSVSAFWIVVSRHPPRTGHYFRHGEHLTTHVFFLLFFFEFPAFFILCYALLLLVSIQGLSLSWAAVQLAWKARSGTPTWTSAVACVSAHWTVGSAVVGSVSWPVTPYTYAFLRFRRVFFQQWGNVM